MDVYICICMYTYMCIYIYIYVTCMHVCMYVCVYRYTCSNWFIIDIVTVIYCFRMRLSTTPFYSGGVDIFLGYILILTSFLTERTWKSPFQIGRHGAFLKSGYSSISSVYKWFFFPQNRSFGGSRKRKPPGQSSIFMDQKIIKKNPCFPPSIFRYVKILWLKQCHFFTIPEPSAFLLGGMLTIPKFGWFIVVLTTLIIHWSPIIIQ